jgi:hypothetical protein
MEGLTPSAIGGPGPVNGRFIRFAALVHLLERSVTLEIASVKKLTQTSVT